MGFRRPLQLFIAFTIKITLKIPILLKAIIVGEKAIVNGDFAILNGGKAIFRLFKPLNYGL